MFGYGSSWLRAWREPWTRDGGVPQECPLSMMFTVALYLSWWRFSEEQDGVQRQLYADNLECVSSTPEVLLGAARFTASNVRSVGQEPAPEKCVLTSTSIDIWDLGGHLEVTSWGWAATFAARVRLVISRLRLVAALPLDFHGRCRVVRACSLLVLCMELRLLPCLRIVCVSCALLLLLLFGRVGSQWLMVAQCALFA